MNRAPLGLSTAMKAWARILVVVWTALSVAGCSTTYALKKPTPAAVDKYLEAGDELEVFYVDGRTEHVVLVRVTDTELVHRRGSIPLAQIAKLRYEKTSGGKTVGAFGLGFVLLIAAGAIVVRLMLEGLGSGDE